MHIQIIEQTLQKQGKKKQKLEIVHNSFTHACNKYTNDDPQEHSIP